MFFKGAKYYAFFRLKLILSCLFTVLFTWGATAQNKPAVKDSAYFLKSFLNQAAPKKSALIANPVIKTRYARPNNQLMSWPNYPLTAYQIQQRDKQLAESRKLKNVIANDVLKSLLSKKTTIAVIPRF
jgi:hypothetical protein